MKEHVTQCNAKALCVFEFWVNRVAPWVSCFSVEVELTSVQKISFGHKCHDKWH